MVLNLVNAEKVHMEVKNLLKNCCQLFNKMVSEIP